MFKITTTKNNEYSADLRSIAHNVDVEKILQYYKLDYRVNRKQNAQAVCPFHDDHSPSFGIKLSGLNKGLWRCFVSTCKANSGGNIFQLVMELENCDFAEAVKKVKDFCNPSNNPFEEIRNRLSNIENSTRRATSIPLPFGKINPILIGSYLRTEKRPFLNPEHVINSYFLYEKLYEPYAGWIVIPIFDSNRRQISYMVQDRRDYKRNKRYPAGSTHADDLFDSWRHKNASKVIIVEGIWDTIKLWELGYPAVSLYSTNISQAQCDLIFKTWSSVSILFDADIPGKEGARKVAKALSPAVEVDIIDMPSNVKDPKYLNYQSARDLLCPFGY